MNRKLRIFLFVYFSTISLFLLSIPVSSIDINNNIENQSENYISGFPSVNIIEMIQKVNQSKLKNHVQVIQDFGPHPTGSDALELVGKYIFNELQSTRLTVEFIDWSYEKYSGKNIVATHQGIGKTDGIVIVCAHYDSVDVSPGADDDGSGVAVVLMLAEIMSNYSFNSTIKFILFSGEEQGKLGSGVYAKNARIRRDNIIGVLALDKIGYAISADDDNKVVHHSNVESDWMRDISIKMASKYYDYIKLDIISWSEDSGSDHKAFVDEGFHGTDLVRYAINPFYHTSEDKIEHMNITYLTKVCNLTIATLAEIAGLNPVLKNDDLNIIMKGKFLSQISQIYLKIENNAFEYDTANVTISVSLKHIFRNQYVSAVKKHYMIPCNWSFSKEIGDYFEFLIGGRSYTKGFFKFEVVVQGFNDDVYLYKKQITYGFILREFKVRMMPRL